MEDNSAAIQGLQYQIAGYERRCAELYEEIHVLREHLEEVSEAKGNTLRQRAEFEETLGATRMTVINLGCLSRLKAASGFASSMASLLSGREYSFACDTFEDIDDDFRREMHRLEDEICDRERMISCFGQEISYLRGRMAYL